MIIQYIIIIYKETLTYKINIQNEVIGEDINKTQYIIKLDIFIFHIFKDQRYGVIIKKKMFIMVITINQILVH